MMFKEKKIPQLFWICKGLLGPFKVGVPKTGKKVLKFLFGYLNLQITFIWNKFKWFF
jgi:hypothetical protein